MSNVMSALMDSVSGVVSKLEEVAGQVVGMEKAMVSVVDTASGVRDRAMAMVEDTERGVKASYTMVASNGDSTPMSQHTSAVA